MSCLIDGALADPRKPWLVCAWQYISGLLEAPDLRHQPPKHQEHSIQSLLSRNGREQQHVLFLLAAETRLALVQVTRSESKATMSSDRQVLA